MSLKKFEFLSKNIWDWNNRTQAKLFAIPILLVLLGLCITYAFSALYCQYREEQRSYEVAQTF